MSIHRLAHSIHSRTPSRGLLRVATVAVVHSLIGVATLDPRKCTGCRLCEDACGWGAIYIDPPRELLKKPLAESVA